MESSSNGGIVELGSDARGLAVAAVEVVTSGSGADLVQPRCGRWMELDGDGLTQLDGAR
jgi:hypothetical protein